MQRLNRGCDLRAIKELLGHTLLATTAGYAQPGARRIIRAAMKEADRISQVRTLWLKQPPDKRTEHDAFAFCFELQQQNRHDLLPQGRGGDPRQQLIADLRPFIEEPPKPSQK